MKKFYLLSLLLFIFAGCGEDDQPENTNGPIVDENGLTPGIYGILTPEVLANMENLGMPINGGATPPQIAGDYILRLPS